jgi:hypothetical protein
MTRSKTLSFQDFLLQIIYDIITYVLYKYTLKVIVIDEIKTFWVNYLNFRLFRSRILIISCAHVNTNKPYVIVSHAHGWNYSKFVTIMCIFIPRVLQKCDMYPSTGALIYHAHLSLIMI